MPPNILNPNCKTDLFNEAKLFHRYCRSLSNKGDMFMSCSVELIAINIKETIYMDNVITPVCMFVIVFNNNFLLHFTYKQNIGFLPVFSF